MSKIIDEKSDRLVELMQELDLLKRRRDEIQRELDELYNRMDEIKNELAQMYGVIIKQRHRDQYYDTDMMGGDNHE